MTQAYIYQAALLCEACGKAKRQQLDRVAADWGNPTVAYREDSDKYPQGPYSEGGGESDTPQHCDKCHMFLENPLTPDGVAYVVDALKRATGSKEVLAQWREFYSEEIEDLLPAYEWLSGLYMLRLEFTQRDIDEFPTSGACDDAVDAMRKDPRIESQLQALDSDKLAKELSEYGAWDEDELADHDANLNRILWLACSDCRENPTDYAIGSTEEE